MKKGSNMRMILQMALAAILLSGCNGSDSNEPEPEQEQVSSLDLTVTGDFVQCPAGNVYLFYADKSEASLSYATTEGDGSQWPLVDISTPFSPVVKYRKDGQMKTIHPVSPYGSMSQGGLNTSSSVRYSQIHFNIASLSTEYGKVGKDSEILVVIILNDPQSKSWIFRAMQLRRDYLIHIYLPDSEKLTNVGDDVSAKWWQVEGDE